MELTQERQTSGARKKVRWPSLNNELLQAEMSVAEFAKRVGVCEWTVRNWIWGEISPSLSAFQTIVSVLTNNAPARSDAYQKMAGNLFSDAPRGLRSERRRAAKSA